MGERLFKKLYGHMRVGFWFVWIGAIVGALLESRMMVLGGTLMILVMSLVLVSAKLKKEKK